ncbi:MAG: family 20 glycosylhydrolase [Oscillospiraceae bacterium]
MNNIAENSSSENLLRLVQSSALSQCKHEYSISIAAHIVELTANSLQGFHFGLTTLKLLLASGKNLLNCGFAQETPDFAHRGVMLDVSRGKMASLDYLKNLVGLMSDLKYNILQLYCEDKLALTEHPSVGRITGAYTQQQIVELDAYCRERFVELQPCIQTYSHVHGVLQLPGYSHLAENDGLFSFAAGNEGVYAFLEDELRETLPWFSSKTLNINMDEAYDIGTGFSSEEVRKKGKGAVFITHIKRVVELARRYGAKDIILWGDVMNKYPELLAELPEHTIIADWNYNPQETYPSLKSYEGKCVDFWAAGGVSTWNSIFPRMYNTYCNLIGLAAEAKESGATGFLVTDWGDYGHLQPLGLSLYGYLVGAQQAFCAKRIAPEVIEEAAWPMIFCDVRVKQAFQNLMDSNLAPNLQTGFKTMSIYYFFDDMLDGFSMHGSEHYPKLGEEVFPILQEKGSQAFDLLEEVLADGVCETHRFPDENWKALFGTAFLRELRLSARMTRFAGRKGELSTQIRATLANSHTRPDDILAHILAIKLLYREFLAIRRDFEDVWMLRAYPQGIEGCLTLFDKAGIQLAETSKWLATQYRQCACGKALDCTLQTYTAAQNYKILWTADFKNMWDRAYPWQ